MIYAFTQFMDGRFSVFVKERDSYLVKVDDYLQKNLKALSYHQWSSYMFESCRSVSEFLHGISKHVQVYANREIYIPTEKFMTEEGKEVRPKQNERIYDIEEYLSSISEEQDKIEIRDNINFEQLEVLIHGKIILYESEEERLSKLLYKLMIAISDMRKSQAIRESVLAPCRSMIKLAATRQGLPVNESHFIFPPFSDITQNWQRLVDEEVAGAEAAGAEAAGAEAVGAEAASGVNL